MNIRGPNVNQLLIRLCRETKQPRREMSTSRISKSQFVNMLKIVQKSRKLPDFRTFFNIFAKLIFALKFNI